MFLYVFICFLYIFHMILYCFYMILYGFYMILYGFYMILYGFLYDFWRCGRNFRMTRFSDFERSTGNSNVRPEIRMTPEIFG